MPGWLLTIEIVILVVLLLIHFEDKNEDEKLNAINEEVSIEKQPLTNLKDTFVEDKNIIKAVSAKSGVIPPWLLQFNPTVIVLPKFQIYIEINGKTLLAMEDDYIVYQNGNIVVLDEDTFLKTHTPIEILGDINEQ